MIKLYDWMNQSSKDLDDSLEQAGYAGLSLVINEDGFLPEKMTSPYAYFCGFSDDKTGRPLYFNELTVPDYWQIAGTNSQAQVFDGNHQRATIFYAEPKHLRWIKNVDWLSQTGKVRFTDHYNQYGWRFARTDFTANQEATVKTYFDRSGQEIIVENFKTGDIILNWQKQVYFFKNRVEFLGYYLGLLGVDSSELWINSLSTPFFVSRYLGGEGRDILFWQEDIGDNIPGNMQFIFNHPQDRIKRIIVQKKTAYDRLLTLLPEDKKDIINYLGYIYPDKKQASQDKEILILTNSDQVEQLDKLVAALPDYRFHIGALTEMSERLTRFGQFSHVKLYPNISVKQSQALFEQCNLYFDINHGSEILDSVRQAFEYNQILFAFSNTAHHKEFVLPEHIFNPDAAEELIDKVKSIPDYRQLAEIQRTQTIDESSQHYRDILG